MTTRLVLAAFALIAVAGCGQETTKGGLSAEEERRLDNAARMLDDNMGNLTFDTATENGAAGNSTAGR